MSIQTCILVALFYAMGFTGGISWARISAQTAPPARDQPPA